MIQQTLALLLLAAASSASDWRSYGGNPAGTRYSALNQINRSNVARLQLAWTFDASEGRGDGQTQPIVINGVLFGITPKHKVIALDAAPRRRCGRRMHLAARESSLRATPGLVRPCQDPVGVGPPRMFAPSA